MNQMLTSQQVTPRCHPWMESTSKVGVSITYIHLPIKRGSHQDLKINNEHNNNNIMRSRFDIRKQWKNMHNTNRIHLQWIQNQLACSSTFTNIFWSIVVSTCLTIDPYRPTTPIRNHNQIQLILYGSENIQLPTTSPQQSA